LAQYEQLTGNKEEAYAMLDTLIQRSKRSGNWTTTARYRLSLADFQQDNKDYEQAVVNYRLYAAENDSAQVQHTNEQINELTKRFELRQLKQENKAARQRNTALTAVVGLLVALLAAILLYARALRRKNRALFQAQLESFHAEEQAEQVLVEESATKDLSAEEKLYAGLLSLMQQEELFKDPDLSRDTLAARLGTNRTYLADAVKSCAGQTLGDFVNHLRLRWAAEALSQESDLSVSAVGEDAGFASRSTFYRLFQQHYGMSPSAFRTAARG
jgi:AraC-like DNA-binding protein